MVIFERRKLFTCHEGEHGIFAQCDYSEARFYKSTTVATMVGGPKDFGGTKELEDLKAGRIQELGGPK